MHRADSLMRKAMATRNVDTLLAMIDSLEEVKLIGPVRANYQRGNLHAAVLNQQRKGIDLLKKAIAEDIRNRDEERYYYMAVSVLANMLQMKHDYEGALRVSIPAVGKMKQSDVCLPRGIGVQLGDIGICQLKMGRYDEAGKSFEESYQYFMKGVLADTTEYSMDNAVVTMGNVTLYYLDARRYDDALLWNNRIDTLLDIYRQKPFVDSLFYDRYHAKSCNFHARILQGKGHTEEAARKFREYQSTEAYKKGFDHAPGEFLMAAHRYAEAVEAYADIENEIRRRVGKPSLDVIQQYLFPKYRANMGAGYKDSALAVGARILDGLDSAIVWQKRDDAAELATIYETQEKDRQIAEQEVALSQQRLVTSVIVFALIVIALVVFMFFRHRAAKRLAAMKAAQERIESELRIARDIQMSMVPSTFPEREGLDMYASMTPAKEVGGDLYGYVLQDDRLYFCVGDVSGKGVPASLFMAQATRLFRTLADQGMQPAEICTQMNKALSGEDNVNGMFVTMFVALLNLSTGQLSFCNAGHNPPVLVGGDNGGEFLDMLPNAPIGLWPELEYEGEAIDSIKGRSLFVYTDGLNEAENRQQQQFGDDRLLDILRDTHFESTRVLIESLQAEVEKHRDGADPNDDLTMLCLEIKS
jgi:serine phosphatase RsbU (regulator of sigma subunit)